MAKAFAYRLLISECRRLYCGFRKLIRVRGFDEFDTKSGQCEFTLQQTRRERLHAVAAS